MLKANVESAGSTTRSRERRRRESRMAPQSEPLASRRLLPVVLTGAGVLAIVAIATLTIEVVRLRQAHEAPVADSLAAGESAPAVDLVVVPTGEIVPLLEEFEGPTLVYFFTTTCAFCEASIPEIENLRFRLGNRVRTIGVALDDLARARNYVETKTITWRVLAAPAPIVAAALRVPHVSTLALVGADAQVLQTWTGQVTTDTVAEVVRATNIPMPE